jgi:hypothetical protein
VFERRSESAAPPNSPLLIQVHELILDHITVAYPERFMKPFHPSSIKSLSLIGITSSSSSFDNVLQKRQTTDANIANYITETQLLPEHSYQGAVPLNRIADGATLMHFIAQLPETASLKLHPNSATNEIESTLGFPLWPVAKILALDIICFDYLDLFELVRVFPDLQDLTIQFGYIFSVPLKRIKRSLPPSGHVLFRRLRRLIITLFGFVDDSMLQQSIVGWLSSMIENAPLESLQLSVQSQNDCTLSISSPSIRDIDISARSGSRLKVKLENLPKLESLTISSNGIWTPHIGDMVTINPLEIYLRSPSFLQHRETAVVHDRFGAEFLNRSSLCLAPLQSTPLNFVLIIFNILQIVSLYSQPFPAFGWTHFCPPAKFAQFSR